MAAFADVLESAYSKRQEVISQGSEAWFRGQSCSKWELWSTVHRYVNQVNEELGGQTQQTELQDLLRREERAGFHRFKSAASPFLDPLQRTDWGYVFAMQHYGLPSRLLDWTASFACALFFANAGWDRKGNAAVFLLNPSVLNTASIGARGEIILDCDIVQANVPTGYLHPGIMAPEEPLPSLAVQPVHTNPRMVVQQARFTICGDLFQPLEKQFSGAFTKYELTPDMSEELDRFLALVGMDWSSYFPDTEGLAKKYRDKRAFTLDRIRRIKGELGI